VIRGVAVAALAAAAVLAGCGGGSSSPATSTATTERVAAAVPAGFLGLVSEDAFAARGAARREILDGQRRTGVQLLRQTFDWSAIEPRPGRYRWSVYDDYVAAVATAGLDLLPIVFRAPASQTAKPARGVRLTATTTCQPRSAAAYARFAAALAKRYGPDGTFWAAHPDVPAHPIRAWQVWNEPNLPEYWCQRPDAAQYARLLRAAHTALRGVDPEATVVTGGLPASRRGIPFDRYVRQLLAAGGRGAFEALAIHPYAKDEAAVVAAVRSARRLLDANGARGAALWVTEIGWSSGGPRSSFTVGPKRQAALILATLTTLAKQRQALRLDGIVYFNWRDAPPYAGKGDFWGLHTGLLEKDGEAKPALSAYYQAAGVIGTLPASG
jgi:hypothetical protein